MPKVTMATMIIATVTRRDVEKSTSFTSVLSQGVLVEFGRRDARLARRATKTY
jgi:hypothetical protein